MEQIRAKITLILKTYLTILLTPSVERFPITPATVLTVATV